MAMSLHDFHPHLSLRDLSCTVVSVKGLVLMTS